GGAERPRLPPRRQPVFQPPRPPPGPITGDPRGDSASRSVPLRPPWGGLAAPGLGATFCSPFLREGKRHSHVPGSRRGRDQGIRLLPAPSAWSERIFILSDIFQKLDRDELSAIGRHPESFLTPISRDLDKGMEIAPLGNCVTSDDRGRPTPGPPQEIV